MKDLNIVVSHYVLTRFILDFQMRFHTDRAIDGRRTEDHMEALALKGVVDFESQPLANDPVIPFTLGKNAQKFFNDEVPDAIMRLLDESRAQAEAHKEIISRLLGHDQSKMKDNITSLKSKIAELKEAIKHEDKLSVFLPDFDKFGGYLDDMNELNDSYQALFRNFIRPIQVESIRGVRATALWAVIGIALTTLISIIISIYAK